MFLIKDKYPFGISKYLVVIEAFRNLKWFNTTLSLVKCKIVIKIFIIP